MTETMACGGRFREQIRVPGRPRGGGPGRRGTSSSPTSANESDAHKDAPASSQEHERGRGFVMRDGASVGYYAGTRTKRARICTPPVCPHADRARATASAAHPSISGPPCGARRAAVTPVPEAMEDSTESPICTDEAKASVKPEGDRACPLYRGLADDLNHQCLSLGVCPWFPPVRSSTSRRARDTRDRRRGSGTGG